MARGPVLVIGLDPAKFTDWDPEPIRTALAREEARFAELDIDADMCLVAARDDPEAAIAAALRQREYVCVVIGGGIRKYEPYLLLFEKTVNLVHRHAPHAAIAFNTNPTDTADAALRWLDR